MPPPRLNRVKRVVYSLRVYDGMNLISNRTYKTQCKEWQFTQYIAAVSAREMVVYNCLCTQVERVAVGWEILSHRLDCFVLNSMS